MGSLKKEGKRCALYGHWQEIGILFMHQSLEAHLLQKVLCDLISQ